MGTRAFPPGRGLDVANCYVADLGAPALASVNRFVTSVNMANGSYTVANASPADGQARNVTATVTQQGGVNDTVGTITVTGTDVAGQALTETISLVQNSIATGTKCFKTVTSVVQAGWTAGGTADTITVGFGNRIGLPAAVRAKPAVSVGTQIPFCVLGSAIVVATVGYDADRDDISLNYVDASGGTYDGSKRLFAFVIR